MGCMQLLNKGHEGPDPLISCVNPPIVDMFCSKENEFVTGLKIKATVVGNLMTVLVYNMERVSKVEEQEVVKGKELS